MNRLPKIAKNLQISLPVDWKWLTTEEVSDEIVDCLHSTPKFSDSGKYCIDTTCIEPERILFNKARFVSEEIYQDRIRRLKPQESDILFSREGTIGTTVLVPPNIDICLGQRMMMFRTNKDILSYFFLQVLNSYIFRRQWESLITGTAALHVNIRDIKKLYLPVPPINEQDKIVSILYNLNKIIIITEKVTDYLLNLKRGLMQRLFTEGIGHNEFKETRVGKIPEEWEIQKIGELAIKMKSGGTPLTRIKEYYDNGEIPFVKIEDLSSTRKFLINTRIEITKEGLDNSNAWIVPKNSWLFAIYGSLGEQAINKIEVSTNQAILGIILDRNLGLPEFYYYWFEYWKNQLQRYAITTTQPNLSKQIFEKLKVVKPNIEEQNVITEILSSTDDIIEKEIIYMKNLKIIKKGLMQDLLTGKKRVQIN
ncbi:hypothetical protein LCGC14_0290440 [marine sediment metagenome]|uniref:Type I restriction modification DNA specificity domain-containing protein n=1 Tax=marine sediment metagenome TaxID=412755 RepID=A0A0F9TT56_9ZZZZ|nr:restriction endonuclease subunit S [archaeon]